MFKKINLLKNKQYRKKMVGTAAKRIKDKSRQGVLNIVIP